MKHSLVRETIVETASRLFYSNGYNLTGINEIISEAGVAKATLYNHFKSKEEICLAYLRHKHQSFMVNIGSFVEKKEEEKKVPALFDFLDEFFKDKDFNGCWCINLVSELPKENQEVRQEIKNQKVQFLEWIETLIPNDTKLDSTDVAKRVYLLYESAVSESHLHQDNWPIIEAKSICDSIIES